MSNAPANHDSSPQDVVRNDVLNAIARKWPKFSRHELSALTTNDDLVSQIVSKYGVERSVAQREVQTLMAGRNL